jgi:hypothetical protein
MADVFPDRSMELRDKIAWMVETNGWALVPVPARPDLDPPIPGYSYSVGLETTYGFPEVVLFGLTPPAARGLLGLVVEFLAGGTQLPVGPLFVGLLDNGLRSALLPVDPDDFGDLFEEARVWHGGSEFRVVQLIWPDRNGWMPWESGFDHRLLLAQPVIGSLDEVDGA